MSNRIAAAKPRAAKRTATKRRWNRHWNRRWNRHQTRRAAVARVDTTDGARAAALRFALAQVGQPYSRRGSGKGGWDCSGLVSAAYRTVGVDLPHSSRQIGSGGVAVPGGQWQPGDIIATSGHVSLYLGDGMMVEASNRRGGVRVTAVRGGRARRY